MRFMMMERWPPQAIALRHHCRRERAADDADDQSDTARTP
jgi:hypothetical protein